MSNVSPPKDIKQQGKGPPLKVVCLVFLCFQHLSRASKRHLPIHKMPADSCSHCPAITFGLDGRGAHLVIPSIIAPSLAFVLVANRIFWRIKMLGRLGIDDVSTVFALVSGKR
jgi:hypothetical protein